MLIMNPLWKNVLKPKLFGVRTSSLLVKIYLHYSKRHVNLFPPSGLLTIVQSSQCKWQNDLMLQLIKAKFSETGDLDDLFPLFHMANSLGLHNWKKEWFTYLLFACMPKKKIDRPQRFKRIIKFDRKLFDIDSFMYSEGIQHDLETYTALMTVLATSKHIKLCLMYLNRMISEKIQPDAKLLNMIIRNCDTKNSVHFAYPLFRFMHQQKIQPNYDTYQSLINSLGKQGDSNYCWTLFLECKKKFHPRIELINSTIRAGVKAGLANRYLEFAKKIKLQFGVDCNEITFLPFLTKWSSADCFDLQKCLKIVALMKDMNIPITLKTRIKILRVYLRGSDITGAQKYFEDLLEYYTQRSLPLPNSLSICFIEMLITFSQIPTHESASYYRKLYQMAQLYFGKSTLHRYWLYRLAKKPERRLGDRKDRLSIPAVFFEPNDRIA